MKAWHCARGTSSSRSPSFPLRSSALRGLLPCHSGRRSRSCRRFGSARPPRRQLTARRPADPSRATTRRSSRRPTTSRPVRTRLPGPGRRSSSSRPTGRRRSRTTLLSSTRRTVSPRRRASPCSCSRRLRPACPSRMRSSVGCSRPRSTWSTRMRWLRARTSCSRSPLRTTRETSAR